MGYRDVGSVLLSKADANRQRAEEARGVGSVKENGRESLMAVMSRRQHRVSKADRVSERERDEADAFPTERDQVFSKKPEGRLRWLHRALVLAARGRLKVAVVFDIIEHRRFVSSVGTSVGTQMKAALDANLHLFSAKQQKALKAEGSSWNSFEEVPAPSLRRRSRSPENASRKRRRRDRSSSDSESPAERKRPAERTAERAAEREKSTQPSRAADSQPVDPRIFSRGAAD